MTWGQKSAHILVYATHLEVHEETDRDDVDLKEGLTTMLVFSRSVGAPSHQFARYSWINLTHFFENFVCLSPGSIRNYNYLFYSFCRGSGLQEFSRPGSWFHVQCQRGGPG